MAYTTERYNEDVSKIELANQKNTFSKHFFEHAKKPVFDVTERITEVTGALFAHTIGLHFLYSFLQDKGPGLLRYDWRLPSINPRLMRSYKYSEFLFVGSEWVPSISSNVDRWGGGFSFVFGLWSYVWETIGKLIGLCLSLIPMVATVPYAAGRGLYDWHKEHQELTQRLANVEALDEDAKTLKL